MLYGLHCPKRDRTVAYDPATGKLLDEFGITDLASRKNSARNPPKLTRMAVVSNHLILLTDTTCSVRPTTRKITVEWNRVTTPTD